MKKIISTIFGICLIPVSISLIMGISGVLYKWNISVKEQFMFLFGFLSYIVIHILFYRPIILHIIGHEVTHALAGWIFGGKLKSLHVSEKGGSVTIDKSNFIVTLAPYFFPIYTLLLVIIYFIVDVKWTAYVIFLIGFTLSFHLALTFHSMKEKQSDFKEYGVIFSLSFILFMNLTIISILISIITSTSTASTFLKIWSEIPKLYFYFRKLL